MWQLGVPPLELVLRTVLVYVLFLGALRAFGKRGIGQFTLFDPDVDPVRRECSAAAITGSDASIAGAFIIIVTIFTVNRMVASSGAAIPSHGVFSSLRPRLSARTAAAFPEALVKESLDDDDLEQALREHGLDSVTDVKLAVLEQDGSISIVPKAAPSFHMREARRRYRRQPQR
jgi:uncharacterized membrane protein YcaP (DUF421 family)